MESEGGHTNFGEGDELASSLASLVDEIDGLANTALKIEPLDTVSFAWVVGVLGLTPGSEVTAAALYLVIAMMKFLWLLLRLVFAMDFCEVMSEIQLERDTIIFIPQLISTCIQSTDSLSHQRYSPSHRGLPYLHELHDICTMMYIISHTTPIPQPIGTKHQDLPSMQNCRRGFTESVRGGVIV